MFQTIVDLALLAVFAGIAIEFYLNFRKTTGTWWQRSLAASRQSATILWQKFVALVASGSAGLVFIADALNAPQVGDAIRAALQPAYVAAFVVVVSLITVIARTRGGSTLPVNPPPVG